MNITAKLCSPLRSRTRKQNILLLSGIFSVCLMAFLWWQLLENIVLISVDDVMYSEWARHGLSYFIKQNIWHFQNFNGRVFVHIVAELVMALDEHLYAILIPVFLTAFSLLFSKALKPAWRIENRLFMAALLMLIFSGLTYRYLLPVFWMASGFNYVFPLFVIAIAYWYFLVHRSSRKGIVIMCILSFLAGSTTEQSGMYMIGLIVMTGAFDLLDKKPIRYDVFCLLSAVVGYVTLFLSPATGNRISSSFDSQFLSSFATYNSFITGRNSLPQIYVTMYLLFATVGLSKQVENGVKVPKYSRLLLLGYPFAAASILFAQIEKLNYNGYLLLLYVVLLCIAFLKDRRTRELGKLIVCGYGSFFMMVIASSTHTSFRTCLPFVLTIILVLAYLLVDAICSSNFRIPMVVLTGLLGVVCLGSLLVETGHFRATAEWCQSLYDNLSSAKDTGRIEYDFDELIFTGKPRYRYNTLLEQNGVYWTYKKKFDLPKNVEYVIHSEQYDVSMASLDGWHCSCPIIRKHGSVYVPVELFNLEELNRNTPELLNRYYPERVVFQFRGTKYCFRYQDMILYRMGEHGKREDLRPDLNTVFVSRWSGRMLYFELNELCDIFGLTYTYDAESNCYSFHTP